MKTMSTLYLFHEKFYTNCQSCNVIGPYFSNVSAIRHLEIYDLFDFNTCILRTMYVMYVMYNTQGSPFDTTKQV